MGEEDTATTHMILVLIVLAGCMMSYVLLIKFATWHFPSC